MATKSPQGGSPVQSELRIVILGNAGEDKNKVVKSVLNCENLTREKVGLCTLYKSEQAGRKISVVEAPGWDRLSIPDIIKQEIVRSVSLCPPGPQALLLVIPVKTLSEEPSVEEIKAAEMHMNLLSERVWKHTIVLFACDEGVEESVIKEHIHSAEKILKKCGRQIHVLQSSTCESPTQISELFKKIDNLVEKNHCDFFIPQAYYELIQQKTQEAPGATKLRQRRGSSDSPPNFKKDKGDSEEKKETVKTQGRVYVMGGPKQISKKGHRKRVLGGGSPSGEIAGQIAFLPPQEKSQSQEIAGLPPARGVPHNCVLCMVGKHATVETAKHSKDTSKIIMDFKQFVVILMGAIGALLGSVAGAENGVRGSFIGIVIGIFVGVLVAIFIMYIYTYIYSKQSTQGTS